MWYQKDAVRSIVCIGLIVSKKPSRSNNKMSCDKLVQDEQNINAMNDINQLPWVKMLFFEINERKYAKSVNFKNQSKFSKAGIKNGNCRNYQK